MPSNNIKVKVLYIDRYTGRWVAYNPPPAAPLLLAELGNDCTSSNSLPRFLFSVVWLVPLDFFGSGVAPVDTGLMCGCC